MSGQNNYGTDTQWGTTQPQKKGNFTFCDSMDGPGEHYAEWNKPGRER